MLRLRLCVCTGPLCITIASLSVFRLMRNDAVGCIFRIISPAFSLAFPLSIDIVPLKSFSRLHASSFARSFLLSFSILAFFSFLFSFACFFTRSCRLVFYPSFFLPFFFFALCFFLNFCLYL